MGMLDGRVAIITGASKGIGRALALRFAREGARVICAARSGDLVKDTTAELTSMALELAPLNIRVNCVAPGAVEGDRIDRVIAGQAEVRGIPVEAIRKAMIERSPLRRMVTSDDIVDATVFFTSDMARSISGQVLAVNAGEPAG